MVPGMGADLDAALIAADMHVAVFRRRCFSDASDPLNMMTPSASIGHGPALRR